jgi:hypothetical protein
VNTVVASETGITIKAAQSGSLVENLYVKRTVTVLAVHDHEVEDISFMNTLSTACFSLASAFVAFAVGILTNAAFVEKVTPAGRAAMLVGVPLCVFSAIVFICGGWIASSRRKTTIDQIRKQSRGTA